MKRSIALILLLVMVMSVCGCAQPSTADNANETVQGGQITALNNVVSVLNADDTQQTLDVSSVFQVGYSRVNITPRESVPICGYGSTSTRMANNVLLPLYATCIAITDESNTTILMFAMDLQRASEVYVIPARTLISQETGVPESQIYISAGHTHSGPDVDNTSEPSIVRYNAQLIQKLADAAQAAMADRTAATMSTGSIETENLNIVKHYKHTTADGTEVYFGDNFGTTVLDETTTYATEVDPTLHLVNFDRTGDKDVVLANWRAHPSLHSGTDKYNISADYIGSFRTAMELQTNCYFAFFQGAGGNINGTHRDRIKENIRTIDCDEFGALLADYAIACLEDNMTTVTSTTIQCRQTILQATVDHSTDYLVEAASGLTGDNFTKDNPYGIRSKYHASAIISRSRLGETIDLELNAVAIGNAFAFVTAPDELFDSNAAWLETVSPYDMTFTLELTNGHQGYIPSAEGYAYTCYESDTSKVVAGTGEIIQQTFLGMLSDMAGEE